MSAIAETSPSTIWLDEELRKEKAQVAELRDMVEKQQVLLADQAQRSLALEDRLAKMQAELLRIPEAQEALRITRDELVLMFSDMQKGQQQREAEAARNRQAEREQDNQAIQHIQVELQRFGPLEEAISARESEDRRLNEGMLHLEEAQETALKRASEQAEVMRQLADRIERSALQLDQVEEALQEAKKQRQEMSSRVLSLEAALPQVQQQVAELQSMRQQLTNQQGELLESQRRAESERSRALTDWGRQMENFDRQMDAWADQLRYFVDQHEKNRRVLREVEDLARQVSQQQDQLRQVQRIAEDRLRQEFREWRSESDHRWAQQVASREKAEETQAHRHEAHNQRLMALEHWRKDDLALIDATQERLDRLLDQLKAEAEKLKQAQLSALQMQVETYQKVLTETQGFLGNEEASG